MTYRVTFEHDPDGDYSWLDRRNTPETYKGNEIIENGRKVPFKRYMEYWGNPERHILLFMTVDHIREDGYEKTIDSLGGIDFMDDQDWNTGVFEFESAADVHVANLNEYQKELVLNAMNQS